ncbi:conserved hypothetical protein; putative exported protein; Fas1 domain [Hyphomicrobium sp. GJ21]|jgi:uncharacterized surface protein with fasciclin (FAS1) repeats|nr:fasciclin domain-containing protein [Hyphomicrobium sp. GJ21]CEJ84255.1 conserved hypothetical protein; putative exported protein; Fas1 domain [Hyphomicrobium sp. GJ21]
MTISNRAVIVGTVIFAASLSSGMIANSFAREKTVEVGGAAMFPSKNIIQNAVNSKDHTTLVAAVKAAGLVKTLEGRGPFTVFAPTNEAFKKLPNGTVPNLLKPENKTQLKNVLTYHVVPGDYSAAKIASEAKADGGKLDLKTVEGEHITLIGDNAGGWWVVDGKGDKAKITIADVRQSNGVIHVIDGVLLPN